MEFALRNLKIKHDPVLPNTPNFHWDEVLQNNLPSEKYKNTDFNVIFSPGVMRNIIIHALMLQEYREWYKKSIQVNSWYRPVIYNDVVMIENEYHTSKNSDHKCINSCATDTDVPVTQRNINKWIEICKKYGVGYSIGKYSWGLHLGWRRKKKNRIWDENWWK